MTLNNPFKFLAIVFLGWSCCIYLTNKNKEIFNVKLIKIFFSQSTDSTSFGSNLGTLEIALLTILPILLICIIILTVLYLRKKNKRGMHHQLGLGEDSIEAPDHPILNGGVSLKHMIEMTTSGSGSGYLN